MVENTVYYQHRLNPTKVLGLPYVSLTYAAWNGINGLFDYFFILIQLCLSPPYYLLTELNRDSRSRSCSKKSVARSNPAAILLRSDSVVCVCVVVALFYEAQRHWQCNAISNARSAQADQINDSKAPFLFNVIPFKVTIWLYQPRSKFELVSNLVSLSLSEWSNK